MVRDVAGKRGERWGEREKEMGKDGSTERRRKMRGGSKFELRAWTENRQT